MQTVTCEILIGGDMGNTVVKAGISVPEIVLLSALHGVGSVTNMKLEGENVINNASELKRLSDIYGRDVVAKAFPGANPSLPKLLIDIGIDDVAVEPEPTKVKKFKKASVDENFMNN
jgi:hypothetical protein